MAGKLAGSIGSAINSIFRDFAYYKIPEKKKAYLTLADAYLRAGINGSISKGTTNYGLNW